jgi:hypothetical protein
VITASVATPESITRCSVISPPCALARASRWAASNSCLIEAPWLVNGGHGASLLTPILSLRPALLRPLAQPEHSPAQRGEQMGGTGSLQLSPAAAFPLNIS